MSLTPYTAAAIILDLEQGTREWFTARCGVVTASRCADVVNYIKKGKEEGAKRLNYRRELVAEILTGHVTQHYVTREMQWGIDYEGRARAAYELANGVLVDRPGFVIHGEVSNFGCSPDGFVGDDGMIQIKCPTTATHLEWMLAGVIPEEHGPQMLAELSCTGRQWNDFVSFDPRLPEHLQLFQRRWDRDEGLITAMNAAVNQFNAEIEETIDFLRCLGTGGVAAND